MKIYLMTDVEGVAGVLNYVDYGNPHGIFFEETRTLLTMEANAAVYGFFAAGATEVVVVAGHGSGCGAINALILDKRAKLQRGWIMGPYPLGIDNSYDAIAFVGQHAKAGSEYAHIPHTQNWRILDLTVNGISIGEFGQIVFCAGELGVPVIFGSGDRAFCKEAAELVPGIETVAVKEGLIPGKGDECSPEAYSRRNEAAIHLQPETARKLIMEGAKKALQRFKKEKFGIVKPPSPPYKFVCTFREDEKNPQIQKIKTHPDSVIGLMNKIYEK